MKKRGKINPAITPLLIGFLLMIIALILVKPGLTGDAILVPSTPSSCSSQEINNLWESNYKVSSSSIIYLNDSACQKIGAYKIDGNMVYTLSFQIIGNEKIFTFINANLSENGLNLVRNFTTTDNFTEDILEHSIGVYTLNRSVDASSALIEYNIFYKQAIGTLALQGEKYVYEESNQNNGLTVSILSNLSAIALQITHNTQTCTSNWTATTINCSTDETGVTYYNDLNNCPNATMPANITTYCDYDNNGVIGSFTSFTDTNLDLTLFIGGETPNSSIIYNTTKTIEFKDGNITRVRFDYNFSSPLNLKNISIKKQSISSDYGYMIIQGIPVSKTITVDKLSSLTSRICAADKEISNMDDISADCDESNEYLLDCPGTNNSITCSISENNFVVSGLTKSAVKEITTINSSNICTPNWTCNSWSSCTNGLQTTTCTDSNNCNSTLGKPSESQACACTPQWSCSNWTPAECPKSETQTRICIDSNNCNSNKGKYPEKQFCAYVSKVNSKLILILVGIAILLILGIIIYFIMKGSDKSGYSGGGIITTKPQIPPMQMPTNPYSIQGQFPPQQIPPPPSQNPDDYQAPM